MCIFISYRVLNYPYIEVRTQFFWMVITYILLDFLSHWWLQSPPRRSVFDRNSVDSTGGTNPFLYSHRYPATTYGKQSMEESPRGSHSSRSSCIYVCICICKEKLYILIDSRIPVLTLSIYSPSNEVTHIVHRLTYQWTQTVCRST